MKADLAKEWLSSEGYRYEIDEDGDLHFKYQGKHMFFTTDERDDMYFRILMPNIYEIQDNRAKVLEACNVVSRDLKVVKAFVAENNNMFLAIEMFVDSTPELGDFFERCCDILIAAYNKAANEIMNK